MKALRDAEVARRLARKRSNWGSHPLGLPARRVAAHRGPAVFDRRG